MSQRRRHVTAHIHRGPSRRRPKATARSARLHAERCRVTASCSRHHAFANAAGLPTRSTARCLPPLHHVEQQRSDDERHPGSHDRINGLTNNALYIYGRLNAQPTHPSPQGARDPASERATGAFGPPEADRQGGGGERDRTDDLRLAKPALSQLSYAPGDQRART